MPEIALGESVLINTLLAKRGVMPEEVEDFLRPDYDTGLNDPALLHDIDKAVVRIKTAFANNEKIAVFADYDSDGIPGAVVLHDCLMALGYDNFVTYIPHRHFEGFGLNTDAIDRLEAQGVSLIITIDCGTSNVAEVAHANALGVDIIITDHHEPEAELPAAVAVVNPKLGEYPFPDLCGAATIFKLCQVLLLAVEHELPIGHEKWWLDMVGIATIADMVPLRGENRVLAYYGLKVLRKSRRPGLQQLLKKARADQRYLTEEDIGFTIGPRINAASRMDTPEDAFALLSETDVAKAGAVVDHLEKLNTSRKSEVAQMTKQLHKKVSEWDEVPAVIVAGHPDWRPSLVGLAANKLAEEHGRPAFLWGRDGNGSYKGSCRSGGVVSVVTLMQGASELFTEFGGHHASGGFSVKDEHIYTFGAELNVVYEELGSAVVVDDEVLIDAVLPLDAVNQSLVNELNKLAPYGKGNAKPLFAFEAIVPKTVEQFGKTKEHLKLILENSGGNLEAIAFFAAPESFSCSPKAGSACTLIAHVEQSYFMGRQQIRLRIVDIL